MDDLIPFGSREYFVFLTLLLFARGMDFLSTWVATPRLVLEGNPIAKWLGWKWGGLVNLALCLSCAAAPLPAVIISTTSLLVAARNFQGAWLMRAMGEDAYHLWMSDRLVEGGSRLFLACLLAQCLLTGGIGVALFLLSGPALVPIGVGIGMIGYSVAVLVFSFLGIWRSQRQHRD